MANFDNDPRPFAPPRDEAAMPPAPGPPTPPVETAPQPAEPQGQDIQPDDIVINIPGLSAIELPEAREAFAVAMKAFGDRMMSEAERLEAGHRDDTSPKAQFTTRMVVLAESEARDIEYREAPRRKAPRWAIPAEVAQYLFTGLFGVAGGAAVGEKEWLWLQPSSWGVVCAFSLLLGISLTVIVRQGRKDT